MREFGTLEKVPVPVLQRQDLLALQTMLADDFSPGEEHFKIQVKSGHETLKASSFSELFLNPHLPRAADSLDIEATAWKDHAIVKSISIQLHHNYAQYQVAVKGDQAWFLGEVQRIESFFLARKHRPSLFGRFLPYLIGLSIVLCVAAFSLSLGFRLLWLWPVPLVIAGALWFLLGNILFKLQLVRINFFEEPSRQRDWNPLLFAVAVAGVVISVATLVVALVTRAN